MPKVTKTKIVDGIIYSADMKSVKGVEDKGIKKAVFPDGVEVVGLKAFEDCKELTEVFIPNSMKAIKPSAFTNCPSLLKVRLSDNVEKLASSWFSQLPEKYEIIVDEKSKTCALIRKSTLLKTHVKSLATEKAKSEKKSQVQLASANAVLDTILQEHKSTIVKIRKEKNACYLSVETKDGGVDLYLSNSNVASWVKTLPLFLDKTQEKPSTKELLDFAKANDLTEASRKFLTISKDGVVSKKGDASPIYFRIPEGAKKIAESAFYGHTSIKTVEFPESLEEIGESAFDACTSLTSLKIPSGVKVIKPGAFCRCSSLTSLIIPKDVKKIGIAAFADCPSLSQVEYKGTISEWESLSPMENRPLQNTLVKVVHCSDGDWDYPTLHIKDGVLIRCHKDNETSIVIPEGVTEIAEDAFRRCKALESVVIPNSVKEIGNEAFYSCESLKSLQIPESLTKIGENAFYYCDSLSNVEYRGTVAQWEAITGKVTLYKKVKVFKCADGEVEKGDILIENNIVTKCLNEEASSITIPDGVTKIGDYAFSCCKALESVVIPNSVKEIGTSAFGSCSSLKSVQIPLGVKEICYRAFGNCSSLKSVQIPEGVAKIDGNTFNECDSLESVVIPDSVKEIGMDAFSYCKSLKSLQIPKSVMKIGMNAFSGCPSLRKIEFEGTVARWKAIEKCGWGRFNLFITVKCCDGEISI